METCIHPKLNIEALPLQGADRNLLVIRCATCQTIVSVQQPFFVVPEISSIQHRLETTNVFLKIIADYTQRLQKLLDQK